MGDILYIKVKVHVDKMFWFCYYLYWKLSFCGKSVRENASPTVSAFQMSSKLGNAPVVQNFIRKEDTLGINAGGTAGNLFARPGNIL